MLRLNWFVRLRQTERIFPNIGSREPRLLSLNPADSRCVCFPNSVKKQSYKTLMVFLCLRHKHQSVEQMFFFLFFFCPQGNIVAAQEIPDFTDEVWHLNEGLITRFACTFYPVPKIFVFVLLLSCLYGRLVRLKDLRQLHKKTFYLLTVAAHLMI